MKLFGKSKTNQAKKRGFASLRHKRAIPLKYRISFVFIIAAIGAYFVIFGHAATSQGVQSNWVWGNKPPEGYANLTHSLMVEEVTPNAPYFWANQFNFVNGDGGYMGLQSRGSRVNGTVGKTVIFSIFSAGIAGTPGSCSVEQAGFDGYDTSGTSCRVAYDWQPGRKYTMHSEQTGVEADGTWWSAWITDTTTGVKTFIARIKVPPAWKGMGDWTSLWTEFFGGAPATCDKLPYSRVRFYAPTRTLNGANAIPTNAYNYYYQGTDCKNSRIGDFNGGTIQEVGTPLTQPAAGSLSATYYSGPSFTGNFTSRTDPNLNFNWNTNPPVPNLNMSASSVRWTGQIVPAATDDYTFILVTSQPANLWVNNKQLIDAQTTMPLTEQTGTVRLEAGKTYNFDLDYLSRSSKSQIQLYWKSPYMDKRIVPSTVFKPTVKKGLSARYSSRGSTVKYFGIRNDTEVNFDWAEGIPIADAPKDNFRVAWIGKLKPAKSGVYKLVTVADDGVQLVLNGRILIDDWRDHSTTRNEATVSLEANKQYALKFQYYEGYGGANVKLLWSGPGISESIIPSSVLTNN